MEGNVILRKSFEFALAIIEYCELLEEKRKYVIAKQLLKSGTSVGANIREAQSAESKADFIHKLKISAKEAEETEYWILLCKFSKSYPDPGNLETKLLEIKKLLTSIISTSKSSQNRHH
ncbi:MAG: four helix bundle protein [Bacteroidetes bacterium]|nr:MAG: four helix bundle protein [Bacteroidota bacterium]